MNITHLGLTICDKKGNHISKDIYLSAKPEHMRGWEECHYVAQIPKASLNYDLNMRYFASLDEDEFNKYLGKMCKKHKFKECLDLNELAGVAGIYIMVLDQYKQVYIGQSSDIKRRIKNHWSKSKSLERLIFGDVCSSVISIDSFGPLDTTRVFFRTSNSIMSIEERLVREFDSRYTLNRTSGGIGSVDTYTDDSASAAMAVVAGRRKKDLLSFVTLCELQEAISEKELTFYQARYPELFSKQTKRIEQEG